MSDRIADTDRFQGSNAGTRIGSGEFARKLGFTSEHQKLLDAVMNRRQTPALR
jgi:hypothetical protein